jgi:hypothetical protein
MLTVVKNQKPALRANDLHEPLRQLSVCSFLDADGPGHRYPQQGRIRHPAQVDEIHPVGEPRRHRRGCLNR